MKKIVIIVAIIIAMIICVGIAQLNFKNSNANDTEILNKTSDTEASLSDESVLDVKPNTDESHETYELLKAANINKSDTLESTFSILDSNCDFLINNSNLKLKLEVETLNTNYEERGVYEYRYSIVDEAKNKNISSAVLRYAFDENENKEKIPELAMVGKIKDKAMGKEYLIVRFNSPYDGAEYTSVYDEEYNSIVVLNNLHDYFVPINPLTEAQFIPDILFYEDEIYFYDLYYSVDTVVEDMVKPQTGNIIKITIENGIEKPEVLKTFTENLKKGES